MEPLEVPPQNLDQSAMSMGAPSSFPVQNMERDREFERQNLQHKSTMETLNATAQLLAQTVAMIGAKTANDVSQQRAKEEQEQQVRQGTARSESTRTKNNLNLLVASLLGSLRSLLLAVSAVRQGQKRRSESWGQQEGQQHRFVTALSRQPRSLGSEGIAS